MTRKSLNDPVVDDRNSDEAGETNATNKHPLREAMLAGTMHSIAEPPEKFEIHLKFETLEEMQEARKALYHAIRVKREAPKRDAQSSDCDWPVCGCDDHNGPCRYAPTPAKQVSGEVREAINETICKHVRAYYDGIKGNREAADAILALSHFTAQSEALAEARERLDSSQSLLAMLYQIGPDQPVWKAEEVDKLLADQMSENRAAIAKIDAASPSRVEGE
jgi:hypothetical protein